MAQISNVKITPCPSADNPARVKLTYDLIVSGELELHGRCCDSESDAQALLALWEKQRAEYGAVMERIAAVERDCHARAGAVAIETAKNYRSAWQYRADFPGLREWCGYEKTKSAAIAAGRKAVAHALYCKESV